MIFIMGGKVQVDARADGGTVRRYEGACSSPGGAAAGVWEALIS